MAPLLSMGNFHEEEKCEDRSYFVDDLSKLSLLCHHRPAEDRTGSLCKLAGLFLLRLIYMMKNGTLQTTRADPVCM